MCWTYSTRTSTSFEMLDTGYLEGEAWVENQEYRRLREKHNTYTLASTQLHRIASKCRNLERGNRSIWATVFNCTWEARYLGICILTIAAATDGLDPIFDPPVRTPLVRSDCWAKGYEEGVHIDFTEVVCRNKKESQWGWPTALKKSSNKKTVRLKANFWQWETNRKDCLCP